MQKPMPALSKVLLVASTLLVAACAGETTSPRAVRSAPVEATKALVGAVDGVYTYTINPNASNTLSFGASRLTLPEHAICRLATSSYGPDYWNRECDDEREPVTITAVQPSSGAIHGEHGEETLVRYPRVSGLPRSLVLCFK